MAEEMCDVGEVRLCFETLGPPGAPTVLLIMGLGLQMVWWRDDFCTQLVDRGFRVIRFDNRDVGRSTRCTGGRVGLLAQVTRRAEPAYTLGDMADDTAGLLAAQAPGGAHVVGVSLGSFIAQELAIRHPAQVHSLTSIMGRPGDGRTGKSSWRMAAEFFRAGPRDLDAAAEHMVRTFRRIGSRDRTVADDDDVRLAVRRAAARAPQGDDGSRQFAAAITERDRTADLRRLDLPALVVHGEDDRVIKPDGGRATADAIPRSDLMLVPGMGHDLPRWVWPRLIDGIAAVATR